MFTKLRLFGNIFLVFILCIHASAQTNPMWPLTPAGGVTDGDKGDVIISGGGTAFTLDADAVTYSKLQNIATTQRVLGRNTAGAGDAEEVTLSQLLDWVGSAEQGDILYRGATGWVRLPAGTSGQFLQTLGAAANPLWATPSGSGDVTAAAAFATDNVLIRSDGTGKGVQATGIVIDDSNNMSGIIGMNTSTLKVLDSVNQSHGFSFAIESDLTLDQTFTIAGAFTFRMLLSGNTDITFPTSGTLATNAPRFVTTQSEASLLDEVVVTKVASGYRDLPVQQAKLPATAPAQIDAGENDYRLLFDDTTVESAWWQFTVPQDYGSSPVLRVTYSMLSATTGSVAFDAFVMATSPGDAVDSNTDSYATVNTTTDAVPGTAGHLDQFTIPLTNADSITAGDLGKIKISRPADAVVGDMEIKSVMLEYTKQ